MSGVGGDRQPRMEEGGGGEMRTERGLMLKWVKEKLGASVFGGVTKVRLEMGRCGLERGRAAKEGSK